MSTQSGQDDAKRRRAEEAARILRRLDDAPDDPEALEARDAFLARGAAEKATYQKMSKAFAAAPKGLRRRDRKYSFALVAAVLASSYFSYDPLRISLTADYATARETATVALSSGDLAVLNAASAVRDETDGDVRTVELLKGAGFFDVETDGQRFVVIADTVRAEALGTQFEVARLGDAVIVTVAEGTVRVSHDGGESVLEMGQRLRVLDDGGVLRSAQTASVADWRKGKLTMDGLSFGEVAELIGNRLPGATVVVGRQLAQEPVVGVLDLTSPENALQTLAATAGARVVQASGLVRVLYAQ